MNNIEILEHIAIAYIDDEEFSQYVSPEGRFITNKQLAQAVENLIQENKELKEKYKRLSIEAQATAFDDMNKDTEGLLRVLLKQGEITLDEKGYYQRKDFDWEENLTMMGLMKKREKNFYIPDDSLDEYIKQLENQLKEYNEMKEIFKKYYVMGNETMYDGCCKMQDEIDELKEKNKELKEKDIHITKETVEFVNSHYIHKSKVKELANKYEFALNGYDSSTADYKQSQDLGRYLACVELLEEGE